MMTGGTPISGNLQIIESKIRLADDGCCDMKCNGVFCRAAMGSKMAGGKSKLMVAFI